MEKYKEKLLDCDDKYSRACATIRLSCEDGPRVHIKGVESPHEIWSILKNQYESSDLATRDNAVSQMVHQTQSDFSTIAEYGEVIKKGAAKCAEMGNPVPSWLLSSFFRLGLNPDLEPYTFQMVNTARTQKRELEIDEMIIALVDHDRRQQFSEDIKALAAKKGKGKSFIEKKGPVASPTATPPSEKNGNGKERCEHCGLARHDKKSCYYLMPANQRPVNWEPYPGKEHLLQENLAAAKPTQSPRSMIVAHTVNHRSKDTRFYLDFASEVHMCYNRLLFSTYDEEDSPPVRTANHAELVVLGKGTVTLNVLVDGKSEVVNFCKVLYAPELEYNLLSVGTIEKAGYSIVAQKGKMTVFDDKDNVALEATRIGTSYLVNVPTSGKSLAPSSILPLGEVELERYDTDSETSPSSHIWSASINFSGSNGSNKGTVDNGDHNIATDTPLENASISASSSLSSRSQAPILPKSPSIAEPEQLVQSGRPKRSRAKPTDYAQLNNSRNPRLKDDSKGPKRGSSVRVCKIIVGSDTPQNDQKLQCAEIDQWVEGVKGEYDLHQVNKTWELTELPQGRKVIPGRWVCKEKKGFRETEDVGKAWVLCYRAWAGKKAKEMAQIGVKPALPPPPPPPAT